MSVHPGIFKSYFELDRNVNLNEYLIAQLPPDASLQQEIRNKLKELDTTKVKMNHVRNIIAATYLSWKWPDVGYDLILDKVQNSLKDYPIGLKSFQLTVETLLEIGYTKEKVVKCIFIIFSFDNILTH